MSVKLAKAKESKKISIMDHAGNILAWSVLIVVFGVIPFYFKNGYDQIATRKYLCLMSCGKYLFIAGIVYSIAEIAEFIVKHEKISWKKVCTPDIFIIPFLIFAFLSHIFSDHKETGNSYQGLPDWFKEGSLYGTKGWYMGFMTFAVFVLIYLLVGHCLKYNARKVYIPALAFMTVECLWGILNRYRISPYDMKNTYTDGVFLGSLGNFNWFAGYTAVAVPLVWGLYVAADSNIKKIVLGVIDVIGLMMIVLNNSDSGIFALAVSSCVLLAYSLTDRSRIKTFAEIMIHLFTALSIVSVIEMFAHDVRNAADSMAEILIGPQAIAVLIVLILIRFLADKGKEYPVKIMEKILKIYVIAIVAAVVLTIVLITVNTLSGGKLPVIGQNPFFLFKGEWGSGRYATWMLGLKTFTHETFLEKIVGTGPDMMYYELISHADLHEICKSIYGGARLTNAHNEWITLLADHGIMGLITFAGALASGVYVCYKHSSKHPEVIGLALAVISYTANNMFSFETITSTAAMFCVLGMIAAFERSNA